MRCYTPIPMNIRTRLITLGLTALFALTPTLIMAANSLTISNSATSTTILGALFVTGTLYKGSGTFLIDDPLDPKNKLLYHSFVESPDAKNLYDGIATLDTQGEATVELPDYFLALNNNFRYLTTPIGQPMPNLYVVSSIKPALLGLFGAPAAHLRGGVAGGRVSWQITGIRHDPYILMHPQPVEVAKGPGQIVDQGQYLCPECYGK